MHKILFYNKFIICLYMFRALCAHHQAVKIVLYSIWYHHTCRWPSGAQVERGPVHRMATYRCDDIRCCIIQFLPPDDEHIVLETCKGIFFIFCWPCISIYLFININQLDALNFIISLFQASTCFEHMCSSSGGQNVIIQSLVSSRL